jgi:hypothetical protein
MIYLHTLQLDLTAVCSMVFSFTFNIYLDGQNIVKLLSLEMDE